MRTTRLFDALQFATLFFVALALVPAGAHLFELPNKIGLAQDQYMTVQLIYRGWALFGLAIFGALLLALVHTIAVRGNSTAMFFSLVTVACFVAFLAIFFAFTYPMNVASRNWTVAPPDFEAARRQWEYSHAVNAFVMLVAFAAMTVSVLASRQPATGRA